MAKETKQLSQETELEVLKEKMKQFESPEEKKLNDFMTRIAKYEANKEVREAQKIAIAKRIMELQQSMPFLTYEDAQRIESFERRLVFFKENNHIAQYNSLLKYKNKIIKDLNVNK